MTGFDLPHNLEHDPEQLLKRVRQRLKSPCSAHTLIAALSTQTHHHTPSTPSQITMDGKTIRDFLTPSTTNIPTDRNVNMGVENYELKSTVIQMVSAAPFCNNASEFSNAHLQQFCCNINTFNIKDVTPTSIRLCFFSHFH